MKFGELMEIYKGWNIKVTALDAEGNSTTEEINLFTTIGAYMKLHKYHDAALVSVDCSMRDCLPRLEVTVRV